MEKIDLSTMEKIDLPIGNFLFNNVLKFAILQKIGTLPLKSLK